VHGQMKRSKIETESNPNLTSSKANRERLRHPSMTTSSSLPVEVYPSQQNFVVDPWKTASYGDDEEDEGESFNENFARSELSATVLCCDYLECRSMGALQKDYLKDHYITYHGESLIKPSMVIPPANSMTQSRSFRCSVCLRKLTDDNQGRTCDNCQRFGKTRAVTDTRLRHTDGTKGTVLLSSMSIHVTKAS
jgi:uncharacterized CHY-type Zn-finger protein